ncbi:Pre-mRNA-splicing factor slt11 [Coemansia sp. RSA 2703]|nr:Pre-mRNA-splicing factor slt11 [Coemansia sp. RSA 2703]KAJ2375588.1 Pre-mRNA-splicing factor slt11 [Coemansia sp. RSA 2607]
MSGTVEDEVEFPILCETCLGENPYVRMSKEARGKECKICNRAFTIFRWLPGRGMRYKKTEICTTCAKLKNVCQTCILDLEHGLPVQVRDSALSIQDSVPKDEANRRDYLEQMAGGLNTVGQQPDFSGRAQPAGREMLKRMARKEPYYKRNRAHICSFFVKGICNRGNECPYRHEMPDGDPELAKQNIVDRYHGNNDPVARRMMARSAATTKSGGLAQPPEDKSITSLFVLGMDVSVTQDDLRAFFAPYGEIKSIVVPAKGNCAFVNFKHRKAAEEAAVAALDGCVVKGRSLRVAWGKPKPKGPQSELRQNGSAGDKASSGLLGDSSAYPSQDPTAMGAVRK